MQRRCAAGISPIIRKQLLLRRNRCVFHQHDLHRVLFTPPWQIYVSLRFAAARLVEKRGHFVSFPANTCWNCAMPRCQHPNQSKGATCWVCFHTTVLFWWNGTFFLHWSCNSRMRLHTQCVPFTLWFPSSLSPLHCSSSSQREILLEHLLLFMWSWLEIAYTTRPRGRRCRGIFVNQDFQHFEFIMCLWLLHSCASVE